MCLWHDANHIRWHKAYPGRCLSWFAWLRWLGRTGSPLSGWWWWWWWWWWCWQHKYAATDYCILLSHVLSTCFITFLSPSLGGVKPLASLEHLPGRKPATLLDPAHTWAIQRHVQSWKKNNKSCFWILEVGWTRFKDSNSLKPRCW